MKLVYFLAITELIFPPPRAPNQTMLTPRNMENIGKPTINNN
jgi:hypothetical protein